MEMEIMKKVMAIVLILVMSLSVVAVATAEESPTKPGYPDYDADTNIDNNKIDHKVKVVKSKVSSTSKAVVVSVESDSTIDVPKSKLVRFKIARNVDKQKVAITGVGNGKKGVFDNKEGQRITKVAVSSKAAKITFNANAFNASNVELLVLKTNAVTFKADAFKGTKHHIKMCIKGDTKLTCSKGALKDLKGTVYYSKDMSADQVKALKAQLKKGGFQGKIKKAKTF